jgi:NitT/TauT family transport system substrate-binding protein
MSRLDDLISDLTSGRITRRKFTATCASLGLAAPALHLLGTANVLALDGNKVRWISPRNRLEVFDDYPYWVAKKYGYFGDIETTMEAGDGSGNLPFVVEGQSDMGYPSPGVLTTSLEQEIPIVSAFEMGAYDVFNFAFRKGEGTDDLKTLEGKTIVVGHDAWIEIVKPMLAANGVDIDNVEYAVATPTSWGVVFSQGEGDAALSWEGLRAQWDSEGLVFDYWLGLQHSKFPANSFVISRSEFDDATTHETYTNYLRGWAMGLEFGHHNPRAAAQIVNEVPELKEGLDLSFPDEKKPIAVASMWQLANVFRGDWPTRDGGKWGWHSMESWNLFFDTVRSTGQLTKEFATEDVIKNDFIAGANEFDKEQVKADALAFELNEVYAAVPEPEGAGSEGAYPLPEASPAS